MDIGTRLTRIGKRYRDTIAERDRLIREAAEEGWTRRAIAEKVGISFARVQQIVRDDERAT